MDDFRLETIVKVSLENVSGNFSEWEDYENCELLSVNTSKISKPDYLDLLEDEVILFLYKNDIYSSIVTNQRVIALKDGKIDSLMLDKVKEVKKPKQYYMIDGEITERPLIKHVIIESDNKILNLRAEHPVSLYFIRLLVCNLFFIKTKSKYYYLPYKYR